MCYNTNQSLVFLYSYKYANEIVVAEASAVPIPHIVYVLLYVLNGRHIKEEEAAAEEEEDDEKKLFNE